MDIDLDTEIITTIAELKAHKDGVTYKKFLHLASLLYERAKEGCLAHDDNQMYRQQGAALAMRDLIESLRESDY